MRARRAVSAREAARLRRSLLQERASLHHELASLRGSAAEPAEREEQDQLAGLLGLALRDVEDALTRLEGGTFGRCEGCGGRSPSRGSGRSRGLASASDASGARTRGPAGLVRPEPADTWPEAR